MGAVHARNVAELMLEAMETMGSLTFRRPNLDRQGLVRIGPPTKACG